MATENTTSGRFPLISIVIPVFNIPDLLSECLESLVRQTYQQDNFEIIIVDDNSTDSTANIASQFCEQHANCKLIRREQSGGPGLARNDGLAVAHGDYILFLDGDDFLPCWSLQTLAANLTDKKPDLATFNWSYCQSIQSALGTTLENFQPLRRDLNQISNDRDLMVRRYLGMRCDGSVIYSVAKRSLFGREKVWFAGGLHEDIAALFKMYYLSSSKLIIDKVLYLKRNRQGSIVNSFGRAHIDGMFGAWTDMKRYLIEQESKPAFEGYLSEYISGVMGALAVLLDKTFQSQLISAPKVSQTLSAIGESFLSHFPEIVTAGALPNVSRYDRLAGSFIRLLSDGTEFDLKKSASFIKLYSETFSSPKTAQPEVSSL